MSFLALWLQDLRWDPTINLGTMLNTVLLLGALAGIYMKLSERVTVVETKLDAMWRWWCAQHDIDPDAKH